MSADEAARERPLRAVKVHDREPQRSEHGEGGERWWATRGSALVLWAATGWPVWRWYAARLGDGSDEPWGLAALVVALALVPWRRLREPLPTGAALGAAGAVLAVICGYNLLPPIVRGGLWMLALAALLGGNGPVLARAGLLLLSLPVVATAQFYLGYPLRTFTAACSVPLLHGLGYGVTRQGTALHWAGETVLVDAPCSGIQMLWTGLFAACALAAVRGLGAGATVRLLRRAGAGVAVANLLRCVALFLVEVRSGTPPEWLHQGIGLVFFGAALGAVAWSAARASRAAVRRGGSAEVADGSESRPYLNQPDSVCNLTASWSIPLLGLLLFAASARPFWAAMPAAAETTAAFPGWPDTFEGRALVPLAPSAREARFAADFPGRVAAFSDGERTVLLRWVARETRKLHPALHCLRGLGYAVHPGSVWRDAGGRCWGTTVAERAGRTMQVRERIADAAGGEWTDVSGWWWDAWRGRSAGPWWAVTVFEG